MKRKVLLLGVLTALTYGAKAQVDVTTEYLLNPSFETLKAADGNTDVAVKTTLESGLYGWIVPSMSNYQVESEASGSATGFPEKGKIVPSDGAYYYFNRKGWGNLNSTLKTTTSKALPAGTYYAVIDYKAADYSNENNLGNNGTTIGMSVTDASSHLLGTNPAVRRAYSMANKSSNPAGDPYIRDAAWNELGTMFTVTDETLVTIVLEQNMKNSGRSDIIYDNLRLYRVEGVSEGSPMDVSGLISNANNYFANNKDYPIAGWSIEGGNTFQVNTWSNEGASDGSGMTKPFIEDWVGKESNLADATIKYVVDGLPAGRYEVGGLIRVLKENGGVAPSGAILYANNGSTDACAGSACTNGVYGTYSVQGIVNEEGRLELGIKVAGANFNWIAFKNFTLKYLGAATEAEYAKLPLFNKISKAESYSIANAGFAPFQRSRLVVDELLSAMSAARKAYDSSTATAAEINSATSALNATMEAYDNAPLNAPASGDRFFVIMNKADKEAIHQHAWTYVYNESKSKDGYYDLKWLAAKNVNYAQSLIFTPVSEEKDVYTISFVDENGKSRYICTQAGAGYMDGSSVSTNKARIRVTTEAGRALKVRITTDAPNIWRLYNTEENSTIGSNGDQGVFTSTTACDLTLVKAEQASVDLKVTDAKWATLILPFAAEIPSELKAYSCESLEGGSENVLSLNEASTFEANTPYIVTGTEGTYTFSGYGLAVKDSYPSGWLTGTYVSTDAPVGSYVLQKQDETVAFYHVVAEAQPTVGAYRAYLTTQTGGEVNAFMFPTFGEETANIAVKAADRLVDVVTLNGVILRKGVKAAEALDGLKPGLYIVDGEKRVIAE